MYLQLQTRKQERNSEHASPVLKLLKVISKDIYIYFYYCATNRKKYTMWRGGCNDVSLCYL